MSETEWQTSGDPESMHSIIAKSVFQMDYPHSQRTQRKRDLFSAACCRLVWPWIVVDDRCRRAIEYLEDQFNRAFTDEEVDEIWLGAKYADRHPDPEAPPLQLAAASLVYDTGDTEAVVRRLIRGFDELGDPKARAVQIAHILRDIVGNPFRLVTCDPAWRTSDVLALARGIYDERAFDRMPILADALQDAGCDNADILNHCRQPGEHVRGCWVVDLMLGKE